MIFFFRYLQIRSYVRSQLQQFEFATPGKLDQCLADCITEKHAVASIYEILQSLRQKDTGKIKSAWEKELGSEIHNDIWTKG